MVAGPPDEWVREAVRMAPCDAHIGLHINLTEGQGLSARAWSLQCSGSHTMMGKRRFWKSCDLGLVHATCVVYEVEAQIQRFTELTGRAPEFVNGHQHCILHPWVASAVAKTLQRHNIKTVRLIPTRTAYDYNCVACRKAALYSPSTNALYARYGFEPPQALIGMAWCHGRYSEHNLREHIMYYITKGLRHIEVFGHPYLSSSEERILRQVAGVKHKHVDVR